MQFKWSEIGKCANWVAPLILLAALGTLAANNSGQAQSPEELEQQRAQYNALRAKSIIDLQPFRLETAAVLPETGQTLRFISLNPAINAWFLLQLVQDGAKTATSYHIENPDPHFQSVELRDRDQPVLNVGGQSCEPWAGSPSELELAAKSGVPFAPICEGRLYLRNQVPGTRTTLERTTDFLRDNVWQGEDIVRFVRDKFFKDSSLEAGDVVGAVDAGKPVAGPEPAQIAAAAGDEPVIGTQHGLGLQGAETGRMTVGQWYPVAGIPDVYASAIQPRFISRDILRGPGRTNALDTVESRANDYMVAFDMAHFDIGYALGTDHPRLGWSERPPVAVRPVGMPGPDGIDTPAPLVTLGMVSPALTNRTVATFAGGFKRDHGAFKYGDLAQINLGSHYGFIEHGVIFSKLQPNLATLYVLNDGTVGMKTWRPEDDLLLPQIAFARQNGVALLETDPDTGAGIPGPRVTQWGAGNWSGSADAELRTLRAGACIQDSARGRYLIYAYFSTATPSAMARTFQAYDCNYAMLLDMNAPILTYMALYTRHDGNVLVEHLVPIMTEADTKSQSGGLVPRFIGLPDNRDMFYVVRRMEDEE